MPRLHPTNSPASAKLVVSWRRRPLGLDGRQAKAKDCFEKLAKEMLRYLDNSNDVKVGITELQERVEVPMQIGISIQQVAQQARSENGQKMFEVFWQEGEELWEAQWEGLVDLERIKT